MKTKLEMQAIPVGLFAIVCAAGCAGSAGAAAHEVREPRQDEVMIAKVCGTLDAESSGKTPVAVFVEIANVTATLDPPLRARLQSPVRVKQVAGILLDGGSRSIGEWSRCIDPSCTDEREETLTLTAVRLPTSGRDDVELEVIVGSAGDARTARVRGADQEPHVAAVGSTTGSVVVTPYYLYQPREASLRTLQRCKATNASPPN